MTRREFLTTPALVAVANAAPSTKKTGVRIEHVAGEKIVFRAGKRPLFEYRYNSGRPKTYVHPFYAPDGAVLSMDSPPDHPHHQGLMLAWSEVNGFDFWGEKNPEPHGQIVHQRFETLKERPVAGFTALNHWVADEKVLLTEQQSLHAPAQDDDVVWLEWKSVLRPTDMAVTLSAQNHVYNGLGMRLARSLDHGGVLNSRGTTDIKRADGESAAWCAYFGSLEAGGVGGVAMFDHPDNLRYPTPFFVMNSFGYLSAAPTYREPFRLSPGDSLTLRYAVIGYLGEPDRNRIDALHARWRGK